MQKKQELTPQILYAIDMRLQSVGKKAKKETDKWDQRSVSEMFVSYSARTGTSDDDEDEPIESLAHLENYIIEQIRTRLIPGQKMVVVIMPDPEVMVQGVVNVFDICRRYKIEYTFKYPQASQRLQDFLEG